MKEEIIEFFKPDKIKLLLVSIVPIIIIISGLIAGDFHFGYYTFFPIWAILIYPLVCSIVLIFRSAKEKRLKQTLSQKTTLLLILISFLFCNPPIASILGHLINSIIVTYYYITFLPGIQVIDENVSSHDSQTGLEFGDRIFGIQISRNDEIVMQENLENSDEFYLVVSQLQDGDKVSFKMVPRFIEFREYSSFIGANVSRLKTVKVQDINNPIPMVEVVGLNPNSPFYRSKLVTGDKIYKIEISNRIFVRNDTGGRWERVDVRVFRTSNTQDFYNAINSAKEGEYISLFGYESGFGVTRYEGNITDWGITVKDIEIK